MQYLLRIHYHPGLKLFQQISQVNYPPLVANLAQESKDVVRNRLPRSGIKSELWGAMRRSFFATLLIHRGPQIGTSIFAPASILHICIQQFPSHFMFVQIKHCRPKSRVQGVSFTSNHAQKKELRSVAPTLAVPLSFKIKHSMLGSILFPLIVHRSVAQLLTPITQF
jgi:hypothetical protein